MSMDGQQSPTESPASPEAFFHSVYESFLRAENASGSPVLQAYRVGGYEIAFRFAGASLTSVVTPALRHLSAEPSQTPALTICLFDSESTGVDPPPPPWSADDYIARGDVQGYNDTRFQAGYNVGTGVLSLLDTQRNLAVYWVRSAPNIPYWETGAPLRTLLHWWMRRNGRQLAHAAAVGTPEGAALVVGRGGSGKSTSALACLMAGMRYLGDDYVLLGNEPPVVYSLYNSAKLDAGQARRFPALLPAVVNSDQLASEKALAFLHSHFADRVAANLPVRALLVPRITGGLKTRAIPASPAAALRAIAPSTIFQLAGAGEEEFRTLSAFVRQMPCFTLELGTDLSQIADAVRNVLEAN